MASVTPAPRNTRLHNFQRWLGFNKSYNLKLWLVSGSVMALFVMLKTWGYFIVGESYIQEATLPGEHYMIKQPHHRMWLMFHLACVFPWGFLSIFQFIPAIQQKPANFHRINGYIIFILLIAGALSSLVVAQGSFGGDISTHTSCAFLALMSLGAGFLAYYNIKRLQLDQHRKWILRTTFYMSSIVSFRPIFFLCGISIAMNGNYGNVWSCAQLADVFENEQRVLTDEYPGCSNLSNSVVVPANLLENENLGSAMRLSFGTSLWIAMLVHAVGVEFYIRLTAGESERLRLLSWKRQRDAGLQPAGSAGTTSDRMGDAKWVYPKAGSAVHGPSKLETST